MGPWGRGGAVGPWGGAAAVGLMGPKKALGPHIFSLCFCYSIAAHSFNVSSSIKKVPKHFYGIRDKLRPLAKAWDLLENGSSQAAVGGMIPRDSKGRPTRAIGHIQFEHVRFTYQISWWAYLPEF